MNIWLDIHLTSWRIWPLYDKEVGYPYQASRIALGPFSLNWRRGG